MISQAGMLPPVGKAAPVPVRGGSRASAGTAALAAEPCRHQRSPWRAGIAYLGDRKPSAGEAAYGYGAESGSSSALRYGCMISAAPDCWDREGRLQLLLAEAGWQPQPRPAQVFVPRRPAAVASTAAGHCPLRPARARRGRSAVGQERAAPAEWGEHQLPPAQMPAVGTEMPRGGGKELAEGGGAPCGCPEQK